MPSLLGVLEQMISGGLSRRDAVVALGGGVIGDLSGLAAALFMRGIPVVQVPTSLLAQVDASVGGKVAVDLPGAKNMVGVFHFPLFVAIDPEVLSSLPDRELAQASARRAPHPGERAGKSARVARRVHVERDDQHGRRHFAAILRA